MSELHKDSEGVQIFLGKSIIEDENDIVEIREILRMICTRIEFPQVDMIKILTAASELARYIFDTLSNATVDYELVKATGKMGLKITFNAQAGAYSTKGFGVGVTGAKKLMDEFFYDLNTNSGQIITTTKWVNLKIVPSDKVIEQLKLDIVQISEKSINKALKSQNCEITELLNEVRQKNQQLEETNNQITTLNKELNKVAENLAVEMSERKTIDIELRKAKKIADAANWAKSDFLANMSHELRTPLNSIIGFSQILYDGIPGSVSHEQQELLGDILDSAKHLLSLINDILDLSKIEAGRIKLNLQSISLKPFLKKCMRLFSEKAAELNLQLSLDISEDLDVIVADELRVKQIIYNLLSNALKNTPVGGEVGIIAKKTEPNVQITVWDTGIGIARDYIPLLFQAFYQIETGHTKSSQGTGLGLYYSKKLVELHGGEIWVESEEGKGSQFSFTISSNLHISDTPAE